MNKLLILFFHSFFFMIVSVKIKIRIEENNIKKKEK